MRQRMPATVVLAVSILLAAWPAGASQQEVWTATYSLAAGGRVEVVNVQGTIEVEGWERSEVEMSIIKNTLGALDDVSVVVESDPQLLRARTVYRRDFDDPPPVHYRLRVPRQVELRELRTVNGNIRVREVEGRVRAYTLNGNIDQLDVTGSVVAHALNGNIRLRLRGMPGPEGELELETVNGDLDLLLPPDAQADLELSTVAGRIESELLYEVAGRTGRALRTRLGGGGVPVRLRTVRGRVRVAWNENVL